MQIFYSFEGGDLESRQTGLLTVQLDPRQLERESPDPPPVFPASYREPSVPRPALGPLSYGGSRRAFCGEPEFPIELLSTLWLTPNGGRFIVLDHGGVPRKYLFDLNRDSIIELEMWDPDGDGDFEAWRQSRLPIPAFLLPPPIPPQPTTVISLRDVGRRPRRLRPVPRLDRPSRTSRAAPPDTTRRTDRFRPMLLAGVDDSRRNRVADRRTRACRAAPPRRSGGRVRPRTTTPASTRDAAGEPARRSPGRAPAPVAAAMRRLRRWRPLVGARCGGHAGQARRSPRRATGTEAARREPKLLGVSGRLDPRPALTLPGTFVALPVRAGPRRPGRSTHRRRGMNQKQRAHLEKDSCERSARLRAWRSSTSAPRSRSRRTTGIRRPTRSTSPTRGPTPWSRRKEFLLASKEGRLVYWIDDALRTLYKDPERFGVCAECGSPIGFERLDIVPWARLCVNASARRRSGSGGPDASRGRFGRASPGRLSAGGRRLPRPAPLQLDLQGEAQEGPDHDDQPEEGDARASG